MLARLLLLGGLLTGCGVGFVDPHPASLSRAPRSWTSTPKSEPVVFGVALDLQAANAEACTSAKSTLHAAIVNAFLPPGVEGTELSFQDLTPDCQQTGSERLDVNAWWSEVVTAAQRYPGANIRPVFVFADNLPGPLPPDLMSDLNVLRGAVPPGTLQNEIWGLLHPQLDAGGMPFTVQIGWTDAADPALVSAITQAAQTRLPFQSQGPAIEVPLFDAGEASGIQAFKVCTAASTGLSLSSGGAIGDAQSLSPGDVPTLQLQWAPSYAQPKNQLSPTTLRIDLETCSQNCDRRALDSRDGQWRRWAATRGCFLRAGANP